VKHRAILGDARVPVLQVPCGGDRLPDNHFGFASIRRAEQRHRGLEAAEIFYLGPRA
jgi:hypothetical protein